MNKFKLLLQSGKEHIFEYTKSGDLVNALNKNQIYTPEKAAATRLFIPENIPDSRLKEIKDAVSYLPNFQILKSNDLTWISGGFGGRNEWDSVQDWQRRGVDPQNEQHKAAVLKVVDMFEAATAAWKQLKEAKIVGVDAAVYIKNLPAFRISKKQQS